MTIADLAGLAVGRPGERAGRFDARGRDEG
jgi:hypothetical protein